jgi:hypothetical protein
MPNEYTRCQYISPSGQECDEWYEKDGINYCPKYHRAIPNVANGGKQNFIELQNAERTFCAHMTFEQLEEHIKATEATIEKFVQTEKTKLFTARAIRAERLESMNEDERRELRKIKTPRQEPKEPRKSDKAKNLAEKFGLTRDALMTMDVDEMLAKFNKSKGGE